jgi:hypothetical protein
MLISKNQFQEYWYSLWKNFLWKNTHLVLLKAEILLVAKSIICRINEIER